MAGSWNQNIKFIQDGERVDANVSGRPDRSLGDRTQYLKDRIDAQDNGQAIFAFDVAVAPSVAVGQVVYWETINQRFEPAISSVYLHDGMSLVNSVTANAVGLVYSKTSDTVATLLLSGKASLDISAAVTGGTPAGRYYLSGLVPGHMEVGVSGGLLILINDGNDNVYVQIQSKDLSENHQHHKMELYMSPAGVPDVQTVHGTARAVITDPDITLSGWLPASHEHFQGVAPPKAAFGYNLSAHLELSRQWPPIPPESASLTVFVALGEALNNMGLEVPTGPNGLVVIDVNGIWWMSDCDGEAPWQSYYNSSTSDGSSISYPECPRNAQSRLVIYFQKVKYGKGSTTVTSLRTDSATSPLVITNLDGNPASAGDLTISFDNTLLISTSTAEGSLVLKNVVNSTFTRGRVIEGLIASNGSVSLTSTASRVYEGDTIHQGIVSIEANMEGVERILLPQLARLIDCKERYENDIMYLGFSAGIESSVRYKFRLPGADSFPTNAKLKIRLWLTGDALTASFPTLIISYRRLPRAVTQAAIPTLDTYVPFVTGMALSMDYYIEKDSGQFSVEESDTVMITITRQVADGYLGEVGIIDAVAILSQGA